MYACVHPYNFVHIHVHVCVCVCVNIDVIRNLDMNYLEITSFTYIINSIFCQYIVFEDMELTQLKVHIALWTRFLWYE